MYLTRISLTNFRSYARLEADVPQGVLLLSGGNAQGKTSFLEALFYCATFSAPLAQNDRQLIYFGTENDEIAVGRIICEFMREEKKNILEVRIIRENGDKARTVRKEVLLNGVKTTAQKSIGTFPAVLFLPQMTRILEGPPDERRRYLNIMLSQSIPGYARALSEYSRVLVQRNALLRNLYERGGDQSQLDYWDDMLSRRAGLMIWHRNQALSFLEEAGAKIHHDLTNGSECLRLVYMPSFDPLSETPEIKKTYQISETIDRNDCDETTIIESYRNCLKKVRKQDIERGSTSIGPHRDDFAIAENDVDLSPYGSRGQIRTALLSLKLAEIEWMTRRLGTTPLLLLDETLAELDPQRRQDLLKKLDHCEQAVLTTTDLSHFSPSFIQQHTVWAVEHGKINNPTSG